MDSSVNKPAPGIDWKRNLFIIWISQILAMAGFAGITPFIPLFFRDRYHLVNEQECGLWISALTFFGFFSFCLSAPLWGILADKYGRKLMLLRSYYVTAILFPLLYFAPNVIWFIAIRFVVSAFSGTVTAAQTLVVTNTPEDKQGFALGTLSTALWSGNMLGFLIGAVIVNSFGYFWAFVICGVSYLAGGILVHSLVREDFVRPAVKTVSIKTEESNFFASWKGYSKAIWILLILFLVMGMARRLDEPYLAILVEKVGGTANAIKYTGWICALAALGGFFSGILIGKLCDRYSPTKIALPATILAACTMVFQAYAVNITMLGSARFFHFFAAGGLEPAFQTLLSRISPPEKRGTLFGMASSLRMVGILVAAILGGGVIFLAGINAVFLTSGVLFLLLIPIMLYANKYANKQMTPKEG